VFQNCKTWGKQAPTYGKYWQDIPGGGRERKLVALGPCATKSIARQKLREFLEREGINSKQSFTANTAPATTFREQSERWIDELARRRRKPVKPATICGWQQALDAWILPNIGSKLLSDVSNGVLRELVGKMIAAGRSPKTICNYVQVVKLVVASAVDENTGEQTYPRKWNHDFIGLPLIDRTKQHRPTVTEAEMPEILASVKDRLKMLFALLAGTGLRIGEALAIHVGEPPSADYSYITNDCRMVYVNKSIWGGEEQLPKTPSAIRVVDVPETLAQVLRTFVAGKSGYLFATVKGRPLTHRNVLRALHAAKKIGLHAFRRFRLTWLRKSGVPKDLERFWMGHAPEEVGDLYSKLKDDELYRAHWAERIGLGFSVGQLGQLNVVSISKAKVA
jgi:integrase